MQAGHAAYEAGRKFSHLASDHPHFCICAVRDEKRLAHDLSKLKALGIKIAEWREPDRNNELTAFATEPIYGELRHHFRNFQLIKLDTPQAQEVSNA